MKNPLKILKWLAVLIVYGVLIYRSATASKVAELDKVSDLVFNKEYNAAKVLEMLNGVYYENLADKWGKPDASRHPGDAWNIGNNKQIIVYYDSYGYVKNVKIVDIEADTDKDTEQTENLETDENG